MGILPSEASSLWFLTPFQTASRICRVWLRREQARCLRLPSSSLCGEEGLAINSGDAIYKESPLRRWTRDGPERTGCLTQKTTEVFKIWICFYAGGHRRITESASHLAACWFLGIPHCEEVHPLPQHHPGGLSLETHSAIGHLYHWALQRKRQGELFPPHSFALQGNVHIYVLNGCFYYCFYLK